MSSVIDWHPEDPATLANPYPIFARMRDEDPCHWSPRLRSWVLTRYDDIKAVCLDKDRLSSDRLRPFLKAYRGQRLSALAASCAICPCGWCSKTRQSIPACGD